MQCLKVFIFEIEKITLITVPSENFHSIGSGLMASYMKSLSRHGERLIACSNNQFSRPIDIRSKPWIFDMLEKTKSLEMIIHKVNPES